MSLPNVDEVIDCIIKFDSGIYVTDDELTNACNACNGQIDCEKCRIGQVVQSRDNFSKRQRGVYSTGLHKRKDGSIQYGGRDNSD